MAADTSASDAPHPSAAELEDRTLSIADQRFIQGATLWRSPRVTGFLVVMYATYGWLPLHPEGARAVGAPLAWSASVMTGMVVLSIGAAWVTRRFGVDHPAYGPFALLEPAWWTWGSLALVVAGGSAVSLQWMNIALFIVLMATTWRRHAYYRAVLAIGVAVTVACFLGLKHPVDALISTLIGGVLLVMQGLSTLTSRRADQERARAELTSEAASRDRARFERERLARDLHDGVGAELTELLWRAASMDSEPANELTGRIRQSLASLRQVVQDRRTGPSTAAELAREVERMGRLLCAAGDVAFEFSVVGTRDVEGAVAGGVGFAAAELVRNAVTHASASVVQLTLDLQTGCLSVRDDGTWREQPAGAGLHNLRRRAETLGGQLSRAEGPATEMQFTWRT